MDWRRMGDFRQRERKAEKATARRCVLQRARANAQTHEAIERFEEVLKYEQEKQNRDIDDLPMEADANSYENTYRSMKSSAFAASSRADSDHDAMHRKRAPPIENDTCMMRPPSPLGLYDYGCLSVTHRSVFAQHKQRMGESTRAKYRQTSCGFYFPGPQFKQGPYGFSMLDPCLLAPRTWQTRKGQPPVRQDSDPADVRCLAQEDMAHKRNRVAHPVVSEIVRTTRAHSERALLANRNVDKNREEKLLEQVRFEKGMYEGKWRDPMLERQGQLPEESPEEQHDWLGSDHEEMDRAQQLGSRILFGLQSCLRNSRGKVTSLFQAENRSVPSGLPQGVLEPEEFLAGLVRLGVVEDGELSVDYVVEAMSTIDPNFDGRVNLPVIARAVNAAHKVQGQRMQAAQQVERQQVDMLRCHYAESLPVEVVKVDRESRSLFNFEKSFEKFRKQQRALLEQHHELGH